MCMANLCEKGGMQAIILFLQYRTSIINNYYYSLGSIIHWDRGNKLGHLKAGYLPHLLTVSSG